MGVFFPDEASGSRAAKALQNYTGAQMNLLTSNSAKGTWAVMLRNNDLPGGVDQFVENFKPDVLAVLDLPYDLLPSCRSISTEKYLREGAKIHEQIRRHFEGDEPLEGWAVSISRDNAGREPGGNER